MLKMQVIGFLGKDALVNQVNGKSVINFSVAHTEKFKSGDELKEKTVWVDCAYWATSTAVAPFLKKGTQVYAEGTPEVRTYQKNDGTTGTSLTLRVFSVQLLSSSGQVSTSEGGNAPVANPVAAAVPAGQQDDLPF